MTIDFLVEIVACTLAKLALTTLPMGGIYIGGGVTNYLAPYFEKKHDLFLKYFLLSDSPMTESVLDKIPVFVLRENPTIDGLQAMILQEYKN